MPQSLRSLAPRTALLVLCLCLLCACDPLPPPSAGAPQGPPAQLGLCVACHTDAGRSGPPGTPRLAGQDQTYLQASLLAYRNGERRHPGMRAIAGALSAADIEALAAWYAAQPACVPDA